MTKLETAIQELSNVLWSEYGMDGEVIELTLPKTVLDKISLACYAKYRAAGAFHESSFEVPMIVGMHLVGSNEIKFREAK